MNVQELKRLAAEYCSPWAVTIMAACECYDHWDGQESEAWKLSIGGEYGTTAEAATAEACWAKAQEDIDYKKRIAARIKAEHYQQRQQEAA